MNQDAASLALDYAGSLFLDEAQQGKYLKRWEHTLRVAAVGRKIARAEGLNTEAMTIACLLHDIGYLECRTDEDCDHHGAISARMARRFLEIVGYGADLTEQICYGILIHTEEEKEFPRPASAFELSVADADNIDRFDAWRMASILEQDKFSEQAPQRIIVAAERRIGLYTGYKSVRVGTPTARMLWDRCLDMQICFYQRLRAQMEITAAGQRISNTP
ncbi:MAG: HD domain-containing protein [Eubacteriales bacterium]|nr:HD domain-containing protein [Eubacteriales bacterium]